MRSVISAFEDLLGVDDACGEVRVASRGAVAWTLLWTFPLVMLMSVVPSPVLRRSVIPVALVGLHLGCTWLFGRRGLVASAPALVYGCSATCWVVTFTQAGLRIGALNRVLGVASAACVVVATALLLLSSRTREVGWFALLTAVMCVVLWRAGGAFATEAISPRDARVTVTTGYLLAICSSAWLMVLRFGRWVSSHGGDRRTLLREALEGLALWAVGFLPLLVVGLVRTTAVWRVAGTLVLGYMGLAAVVLWVLPSLRGRLGLVMLPLLMTITGGVCAVAKVKALPPYRSGRTLIELLKGGVAARVTGETMPLLEAAAHGIFEQPLSVFLRAVLRKKAWIHMSDLLMTTLCLLLGFFALCLLVRAVEAVFSWLHNQGDRTVEQG